MKVKEFIKHLQTLDQEKDIHIVYECSYVFDPEISIANDDWIVDDKTFVYKKGDYLIEVDLKY
jgi:hypothetical protein